MSLSTVVSLIATPLMALLGVLVGQRVARASAVELDRWRTREETMRLLRWATELAVEADARRRGVGLEFLGALARAPLLDVEDEALVSAVYDSVARRTIDDDDRRPP
jgi:GNAT superfamily N-acetyltransferase